MLMVMSTPNKSRRVRLLMTLVLGICASVSVLSMGFRAFSNGRPDTGLVGKLDIPAQAQAIIVERERLDREVWAEEVLAQEY